MVVISLLGISGTMSHTHFCTIWCAIHVVCMIWLAISRVKIQVCMEGKILHPCFECFYYQGWNLPLLFKWVKKILRGLYCWFIWAPCNIESPAWGPLYYWDTWDLRQGTIYWCIGGSYIFTLSNYSILVNQYWLNLSGINVIMFFLMEFLGSVPSFLVWNYSGIWVPLEFLFYLSVDIFFLVLESQLIILG